MKKFKTKKRYNIKIYILIIILLYLFTTKILVNIKLESSNEEFIRNMLNDNNYYKKYNKNYINLFTKYILNIDIKNPKAMLESIFKYKYEPKISINYVSNDLNKEPVIYIYNTHESEGYIDNTLSNYNINPNVKMASYLLQGLLEKDGIKTIVEDRSMKEYLDNNKLDYQESYQASRFYLQDTLNKYKDLKLIIDLHRDAVKKEYSTIKIDDKNYAKVMFVVGKNYDTYQINLDLANKINNMIKEKYPNLTRGVLTKDGKGIRAKFNQDLNPNVILIECGGNENSIDEVMNTIVVLKDIIKEYLGGING